MTNAIADQGRNIKTATLTRMSVQGLEVRMSKLKDYVRRTGERQADNNFFTDKNPVDIHGNKLPLAPAIVAKCVAHYRTAMKPLKTIWLRPKLFSEFCSWSRTCMTVQEADSEVLNYTFDGVFIKEGSVLQKDDMTWDFYPMTIQGKA